MSAETKVVLFNAVPMFALAAAYAGVTLALVPHAWRARRESDMVDLAIAFVFPAIAVAAGLLGALLLRAREPLVGHLWLGLLATLLTLAPAVLFLARRHRGSLAVVGAPRRRSDEQPAAPLDGDLDAVTAAARAFAGVGDPVEIGRVLCDEAIRLLEVDAAMLATVDAELRVATGLVGRTGGSDVEWWPAIGFDLDNEPSGTAVAVADGAPFAIYDAASSPRIDRRLVEQTGAKSAAFVPLLSGERVVGVLTLAATRDRRSFAEPELGLMQAIANEAAAALERTRSASALTEALERERLVARISRQVRSEQDVQALTESAVEEVARAVNAARCFVRLGEPSGAMRIYAQWTAAGVRPIGDDDSQLPVLNLAARDRRTVAIADVVNATELRDPELGGRVAALKELGTGAALAVPIVVFEELIGVIGLHRTSASVWTTADISLAEAAGREIGFALYTARLLAHDQRRLERQAALLNAAQALTSDLHFDAVIHRLVEEVVKLLGADAADCWILEGEKLRCRAVAGLPSSHIGRELSPQGTIGAAMATGRPVLKRDWARTEEPPPSAGYSEFEEVMDAPITWLGEVRGVLGVCARDSGRFEESDLELLDAFASLASLALRNADSFEQTSRQAQVQRGFFRIASILSESLSLEETLHAVAQAAADSLGAAAAAVLVPEGGVLRLAGAHELRPEVAAALEEGNVPPAVGAVARDRRLLAARRVDDDERFDDAWRAVAAEASCESLLAIPVDGVRAGEAGVALVLFTEERVFTDADLDLARHVMSAARGALERASLFEAERNSRALSQQLARTGTLLATELDPAAVLDEVVQQAPALLGVDACSVRALEGDELVVAAATGEGSAGVVGTRAPYSPRLAGEVVQSRAPVAVANVERDGLGAQDDPLLAAGYAAYLGVPLLAPEGALHGVLSVYARRPRDWRTEEVEALAALAVNASAAVANAELYQRVALEREQSAAILANIADAIVAVDRDGEVVLWNKAAEQITGVPAEEALGRTAAQVLQRELEVDGDTSGSRLVAIRRGGEEVWLSLSEAVMRDPLGVVAGRIFAFRDISSERVVEQMKSDFVSTVSHELRTPLTSIYGFAETLLRQDVAFSADERRTFLQYIASESERLTSIVDALLNVAQLDTGDLQVNLAPTDVRQVVTEVVTTAEQAASNGHSFVLDVPESPVAAEADREKLRQILAHLVENAVKYSPGGGTVTVGVRRRNDAVEVRVEDEGIGIPPTERERIFTKFYRADAAAPASGPGLGLFLARGLVTAMGGRIWVDSTEGHGSTFAFELPLADGAS